MADVELLKRIVLNPNVMAGKPVIRGTRLTVPYIIGRLAHGNTTNELLEEYPGLRAEDIGACLAFAQQTLESTSFLPFVAESA